MTSRLAELRKYTLSGKGVEEAVAEHKAQMSEQGVREAASDPQVMEPGVSKRFLLDPASEFFITEGLNLPYGDIAEHFKLFMVRRGLTGFDSPLSKLDYAIRVAIEQPNAVSSSQDAVRGMIARGEIPLDVGVRALNWMTLLRSGSF